MNSKITPAKLAEKTLEDMLKDSWNFEHNN
jgi:hypothetical protein